MTPAETALVALLALCIVLTFVQGLLRARAEHKVRAEGYQQGLDTWTYAKRLADGREPTRPAAETVPPAMAYDEDDEDPLAETK